MNQQQIEIAPQPGPQTDFLTTNADIALYGGAAGGGKTFALLLDPLRHYENKNFGCVTFRRNTTQVRNEGGLWDESMSLYSKFMGHSREATLEWTFPSGARAKFAHLEHERTIYDWQGSQIPAIYFDELTHFTESQFLYMLSRNRSTCGVKPYVRATCNPDVKSWVRKWLDWYIDSDGFAIPERSGKIRWFIRLNDTMYWADSRDQLISDYGPDQLPKSFTFISSKLSDNKILMEKDPGYLANLRSLSNVERERLLNGNWNIAVQAGNFFKRQWFEVVQVIPGGWTQSVRYWDRASSKVSPTNSDPDWTRGLKMYRYPNNTWCVVDLRSLRDTPLQVEQLVKGTAGYDGHQTTIVGEQDPGSAGVADAGAFARMLAGYIVKLRKPTQNKEVRARAVAAQAEAGNIKVLRASWNEEFFTELENFPDGAHDDIVDVLSGAFNELANLRSILDVL